jgi:transcriptional regulator with XRE-family HTH domain
VSAAIANFIDWIVSVSQDIRNSVYYEAARTPCFQEVFRMGLTMMGMATKKKTTTAKQPTTFGQRLAELRKLRGLTQVQLAQKLDSTQRAITYYENEASYPPVDTIVELAKILGVTTDELLGISNGNPVAKSVDLTSDPELRRLWRKFQQIARWPEKDRNAVIRIINTMTKSATS